MCGSEQESYVFDVPRAERVARLNDTLRKSGVGGRIVVTQGVRSLEEYEVATLLAALRDYDSFDVDNDPHGERDFGDVDYCGAELLWKIDYFDTTLTWGSPDPADAAATQRVLTVMLAEEY